MQKTIFNSFVLVSVIALSVTARGCLPLAEPEINFATGAVAAEMVDLQTREPSITPNPTATQIPSPTKTSLPTLTPILKLIPPVTPTVEVLDRFESPDGVWLAILEREKAPSQPDSYIFRVVESAGEQEWIVEQFEREEHSMVGYERRIPIFWSKKGESMYFVHDGFGDGCGPISFGYDLHQLNLQTGETTELISQGEWFAFAPNEDSVAFLLNGDLIIHDLLTSEEIIVELKNQPSIEKVIFSDLTWSPDGGALLILGAEDVCAPGMLDKGQFFITRVDAQTYVQSVIMFDSSSIKILSWPEPNRVQLSVSDGFAWLDPETGEIFSDDD